MINNTLKKVFIVSALVGSLVASDTSEYLVDTYSLVGFEGGYGNIDVDNDVGGVASTTIHKFPYGGIKIGAQSEDYRLFVSARYYNTDELDYLTTYGAELQYMFNVSSYMNFYLGVNGGIANSKLVVSGTSRTISDPYIGGDAGMNIHLGETVDLELGARVMSIDAANKIGGVTYTFNSIVSGYASIIFKYKMD